MWILNEIESHKKKNATSKIIITSIIVLWFWYFWYSYFSWNQETEIVKEIQSFTVTTWDLKTSISWDGKVLYKEDYNLNFPISWTVKRIERKEWDLIKKWEIIASLDTTYLELAVDKAEIAIKKANDDLNMKKNQYSSSDIKLSKEQLSSTETNLNNIRLAGEIDIENAKKSLETAEINLQSAKNNIGNTKTLSNNDIANFEIALTSAKKDLEASKANLILLTKQEQEKYENKQEDAITVIWANVSFMKQMILDTDELLWVTDENKDKNDSFENFLWAKDKIMKNLAINTFSEVNNNFDSFLSEWKTFRSWEKDLTKVEDFLKKSEANSRLLNKTLGYTLETIKNSISSAWTLSESDLENYTKTFEINIINTKKEITAIINAKQSIEEQKTALESKVLSLNNTIESQESKLLLSVSNLDKSKSNSDISWSSLDDKVTLAEKVLEQAKANYENAKKKAENNLVLWQKQINISEASLWTKTVSYSELAPLYTNIENAKKSLEEAKKKLEDAILTSPIDGKIVTINWNIGSFVWGDKETSFATITNNNKFYVESFVEELDISRVQENAKVYLTFDALDWVSLDWTVYYISDRSTTDNNWIVSYKVEIQFEPKTSWVREWMTTYAEYITNEVKNVKIIPVWAVKPVNWKPSVQKEDKTWQEVLTGFTDWKMVEIISWLEKGEKVIY